jgi:biopolymer transport protein TolQ
MVKTKEPIPLAVMGFLLLFSLLSWTIIFSKWTSLRKARSANRNFLRTFRKTEKLDAIAAAGQQYPTAPLAAVFDFGYDEVNRQMKSKGRITNFLALERTLQVGVSEEIAKLERSMNWLATTASVSPFIGLLGLSGSTSMRVVAPGIANALVATALGLAAAIPAAIFYNHFGHAIKEMAARMEDFSLEFMNLTERTFEG